MQHIVFNFYKQDENKYLAKCGWNAAFQKLINNIQKSTEKKLGTNSAKCAESD